MAPGHLRLWPGSRISLYNTPAGLPLLLSFKKKGRGTSRRTRCHCTKIHMGKVTSPSSCLQDTETGSCLFFSLPTWRVIVMPLTTRHPQPPEPLHPCCVTVYSPAMPRVSPQTTMSKHGVHISCFYQMPLRRTKQCQSMLHQRHLSKSQAVEGCHLPRHGSHDFFPGNSKGFAGWESNNLCL